jgi:hypothetical protein
MTLIDLETSIKEAVRYIDRCNALKLRLAKGYGLGWPSREQAAVKRSSMDLSNALVRIRGNQKRR